MQAISQRDLQLESGLYLDIYPFIRMCIWQIPLDRRGPVNKQVFLWPIVRACRAKQTD